MMRKVSDAPFYLTAAPGNKHCLFGLELSVDDDVLTGNTEDIIWLNSTVFVRVTWVDSTGNGHYTLGLEETSGDSDGGLTTLEVTVLYPFRIISDGTDVTLEIDGPSGPTLEATITPADADFLKDELSLRCTSGNAGATWGKPRGMTYATGAKRPDYDGTHDATSFFPTGTSTAIWVNGPGPTNPHYTNVNDWNTGDHDGDTLHDRSPAIVSPVRTQQRYSGTDPSGALNLTGDNVSVLLTGALKPTNAAKVITMEVVIFENLAQAFSGTYNSSSAAYINAAGIFNTSPDGNPWDSSSLAAMIFGFAATSQDAGANTARGTALWGEVAEWDDDPEAVTSGRPGARRMVQVI
jgi:hypothetical protein